MKRLLCAALIVLAGIGTASARDSVVKVSLADVLAMPEAQGKLDGSVKFFLAGAATPKVQQRLGSG
ncbi:MAG: excinuclease ATPase subunit, partial [Xanthomonadales bacterium]|nr:excinuclease ATPase subunit [Xanthomonadales bacterium]